MYKISQMVGGDQKKIFICFDYFFPGFKGGGPTQSLINLVLLLEDKFQIFFITSAFDMHSAVSYENIKINSWNDVMLPTAKKPIQVWYSGRQAPALSTLTKLLREKQPDFLYLNSVFSIRFFLVPLIASKYSSNKIQVVLCPRGMLQKGTLGSRIKILKKKIFISFLNLSSLLDNVRWHATNLEEKEDILFSIKKASDILIAENIPKKPLDVIAPIVKNKGELKLIYLSLITSKKNLLLLLQIMKKVKHGVTLSIYGPPKDLHYWHKCQLLLNQMPEKVKYMGEVNPVNVQKIISESHVLILPTKGENFGHALYESLSVGRPIITSNYTIWNNLKQSDAGFNIDINDDNSYLEAFDFFCDMDQKNFSIYCEGALKMAKNYSTNLNANSKYEAVFRIKLN